MADIAVCPNDGTTLTKSTAVNAAGHGITRWVCPLGDFNGPWFVGNETGELNQIPEVTRQVTRLTGSVTTAAAITTGTADHNTDVNVTDIAVTTLLAANANRKSALIQNNGTGNIRVTLDGVDPAVDYGIRVAGGRELPIDPPYIVTGAIKAISEVIANVVGVTEIA